MNQTFLKRLIRLTTSEPADNIKVTKAMKILGAEGNVRRFRASLDALNTLQGYSNDIPHRLKHQDRVKKIVEKLFRKRIAGHYKWYDSVKYLGL